MEGKPLKVDGHKPSHPGGKALGLCHVRLDFDGKTKFFQETLGSGAWCDAMEAAVLQMREHEVAEASSMDVQRKPGILFKTLQNQPELVNNMPLHGTFVMRRVHGTPAKFNKES